MGSTSLLPPRLNAYFQDYASYHRTRGNKFTHYFGVPMIATSVLGILGGLVIGPEGFTSSFYFRLDAGVLLLTLGFLWYLFLDWKIALPFILVLGGFYFLGRALPTWFNITLFVVGWILQGVGHAVYEKNSPAFFKNLTHLLIGPLWIFAHFLGYK